jgi:signal transduction histidine kinase
VLGDLRGSPVLLRPFERAGYLLTYLAVLAVVALWPKARLRRGERLLLALDVLTGVVGMSMLIWVAMTLPLSVEPDLASGVRVLILGVRTVALLAALNVLALRVLAVPSRRALWLYLGAEAAQLPVALVLQYSVGRSLEDLGNFAWFFYFTSGIPALFAAIAFRRDPLPAGPPERAFEGLLGFNPLAMLAPMLIGAFLIEVAWHGPVTQVLPLAATLSGVTLALVVRVALANFESAAHQRQVASLERRIQHEKAGAVAEKLALVGRLSAGMAHEINNPISALAANLQYLQAGVARGLFPEDAAECLGEAVSSARRVGGSVRQLLLLSRAAAAEGDGGTFDLAESLQRAVAAAQASAGRSGWAVSAAAQGLQVGGRGQLLERLLSDLLACAARTATPQRPLRLQAVAEGDDAVLRLRHEDVWLPATLGSGGQQPAPADDPKAQVDPLVLAINLLQILGARISWSRGPEGEELRMGLRLLGQLPGPPGQEVENRETIDAARALY